MYLYLYQYLYLYSVQHCGNFFKTLSSSAATVAPRLHNKECGGGEINFSSHSKEQYFDVSTFAVNQVKFN